jgi:hypothetical protein
MPRRPDRDEQRYRAGFRKKTHTDGDGHDREEKFDFAVSPAKKYRQVEQAHRQANAANYQKCNT